MLVAWGTLILGASTGSSYVLVEIFLLNQPIHCLDNSHLLAWGVALLFARPVINLQSIAGMADAAEDVKNLHLWRGGWWKFVRVCVLCHAARAIQYDIHAGPSTKKGSERQVRQNKSKKKLDVGILNTTKLVYLGYRHENFWRFRFLLPRVLR